MSESLTNDELMLSELESSFLKWRGDLENGNYEGLEESVLTYNQKLRGFLDKKEISKLSSQLQQALQHLLSEQQSLSNLVVELKDETAGKIMALRKGRDLNSTYHSNF